MDLKGAAIEGIWCEAFRYPEDGAVFQNAQVCISWLYEPMKYERKEYAEIFPLHSLTSLGEDPSDE